MNTVWNTYWKRAGIEGHLNTWMYMIGAHILPKLGLHIKYVYTYDTSAIKKIKKLGMPLDCSIISSIEELKKEDIQNLLDFEGQDLVNKFEDEFKRGNQCAVARPGNIGLSSVIWISKAPVHMQIIGYRTFLLGEAFTLPKMRGKGLLILLGLFIIKKLVSEDTENRTRLIASIIFSNRSSIRATLHGGFVKIGTIFIFLKWGLIYFKELGTTAFRFFKS